MRTLDDLDDNRLGTRRLNERLLWERRAFCGGLGLDSAERVLVDIGIDFRGWWREQLELHVRPHGRDEADAAVEVLRLFNTSTHAPQLCNSG